MNRGQLAYSGSVEEGIQQYEQLNRSSDESQLVSDSFLSVHPPITAFSANLKSDTIQSGGALQVEIDFNSEAAITDFAIKVLFYNSKGAFAADGCIEFQEDEVSIYVG